MSLFHCLLFRFFLSKCFLFFFIQSFFWSAWGGLNAQEAPKSYNPIADIDQWAKMLTKQNHFLLLTGSLFEKEAAYFSYAPSNMLADFRYTAKVPAGAAFLKEKNFIQKHLNISKKNFAKKNFVKKSFAKSLYIQTAFNFPGKESFVFKAKSPTALEGHLLYASLWVHSQKYLHRLFLLFKTAKGKNVSVSAGRLFWHGWRRLHIILPKNSFQMSRIIQNKKKHLFLGFKITSAPHSPAGSTTLLLDNLFFLTDAGPRKYHGSEIEDTWEKP